MTKYEFRKSIKGLFNSVRRVGGVTVANVAWLNKPWRIVENGKTFDEVSDREYKPLAEFRISDDMYEYFED